MKSLVVTTDNLMASVEHIRISIELCQSDRGHDIGHVAFIVGCDDIVFPGTRFVFRKRVLGLPVEGEKHVLLIDRLTVEAVDIAPYGTASFGGGQILDRVEGQTAEISDLSAALAVPFGT